MRVVVTNPPWDGVRAGSRWPTRCEFRGYIPTPIHLLGGTASLRQAGHNVTFIDAVAQRMRMRDLPDYLARVEAIKPELIIQEISTPSIADDLVIAEALSKIAPVAVSGPHATTLAHRLLEDYPFIFAVLQGEIELNSIDLANEMERKVYGYKSAKNLDDYPDPALEHPYLYRDVSGPRGGTTLQTWASRGCAYKCSFCIEPWRDTGKANWRTRSAARVAAEAKRAHELFPLLDGVYLDGPTENMNDKRSRELADALFEVGIPFGMMTRVDTNTLETWDYMIDRGLYYVKAGMESANQGLANECGKRLDIPRVRETVLHLKKRLPPRNIHLTCMYGIKGESPETVEETLRFLQEMGVWWQESYMAPTPGTSLWEKAAEQFPVEQLAMAGQTAPGNPEVAGWVKAAKERLGIQR